jgi:hypothetical protein
MTNATDYLYLIVCIMFVFAAITMVFVVKIINDVRDTLKDILELLKKESKN